MPAQDTVAAMEKSDFASGAAAAYADAEPSKPRFDSVLQRCRRKRIM